MKKRGKNLIVLLAACGIIASGVGLMTNVAGLFFTPIADDLHLERGTVAMTLTISNLVYAVGGIFSSKLITDRNFRISAVILTALLGGSTILMASAQNVAVLYICNAIRGFAGGVLGFVLATTILNAWFKQSNGLATSIAMSTSGIAGALFSTLISSLITVHGWRAGYVCTGILMILFNLPLILLLPSLRPHADEDSSQGKKGTKQSSETVTISRFLFLMVFLFAFLGCAITAVPQHFPAIAQSYHTVASVGAMMLSASMLANTFGKIIMGWLTDHIGAKRSILLYAVLAGTGCITLLTVREPAGMLISAVLIGLSYSLGTVGTVMLTKEMFGEEGYGKTYPVTSLGGTVGNALYSSVIGYLYDGTGNYDLTLLLAIGFAAFTVISTLICCNGKKRSQSYDASCFRSLKRI